MRHETSGCACVSVHERHGAHSHGADSGGFAFDTAQLQLRAPAACLNVFENIGKPRPDAFKHLRV